jgi:hypothetical protein
MEQREALHAVASKYFLATLTQLRSILLQTQLNSAVIAQLLPAKALGISCASLLLLGRPHVTLCKRQRSAGKEND